MGGRKQKTIKSIRYVIENPQDMLKKIRCLCGKETSIKDLDKKQVTKHILGRAMLINHLFNLQCRSYKHKIAEFAEFHSADFKPSELSFINLEKNIEFTD